MAIADTAPLLTPIHIARPLNREQEVQLMNT